MSRGLALGEQGCQPPSTFTFLRAKADILAGLRVVPTEPALASLGAAALPGRWGGAAGPLGTARGNGRWCVEGAGRAGVQGSAPWMVSVAVNTIQPAPSYTGAPSPGPRREGAQGAQWMAGRGVGVHVCGVSVRLWRPGEPPRGQGHLTCSCLYSVSGELECQLPVWA